jgi:hypothetical protein
MLKLKKIYRLGVLTFLFFGSIGVVNVEGSQDWQILEELENGLTIATNSESHYVLKKIEWLKFRENFDLFTEAVNHNQDSLSNLVLKQADSLMRYKSLIVIPTESKAKKFNYSFLSWILFSLSCIINIIGLVYVFTINTRNLNALEQCQNIESRYVESQRHWIDKERNLKRQLIDANNKVNELEQKLNLQ